MTLEKRIARLKTKLAANVEESKRQAQYAGERLGVFARLKELEQHRWRLVKTLMQIDPANETAYWNQR